MIVNNIKSGFDWTPDMSPRAKWILKIFTVFCVLTAASILIGLAIFIYQDKSGASAEVLSLTANLWFKVAMGFGVVASVLAVYGSTTTGKPWAISSYDKSGLSRLQAANKYWMERGLDGEYIGQNDLSSRGVWTPKASGAGAGGVYGVWTHPSGLRLRRVSYSQLSLDERTIRFHQTEYLELSLDGRGKDNDTTVLTLTRDRDQEPVCSVVDDFDRVLLWPVLWAFELAVFSENDLCPVASQIHMAIKDADHIVKSGSTPA